MQYDLTGQIGATLIVVGNGISLNVQFIPGQGLNGGLLKIASGGGTLAIVKANGFSTTSGYPIGNSEVIPISGPATFFLAASGATMIAAFAASYTQGYSQFP